MHYLKSKIKQYLAACGLLITMAGCQYADKPVATTVDTAATLQASKPVGDPLMIAALKNLRQTLASGSKEQVAAVFGLPAKESVFSVFIEDSSYLAAIEQEHGMLTVPVFVKYFNQLATNMQLQDFKTLLVQLPLDSLAFTTRLEKAHYQQNKPCYPVYRIEVKGREVTLTVEGHSNDRYVTTSANTDEVPENDSAICEHQKWWVFRLEGSRLVFVGQGGAD
jgi:hypothetical protein